MHNDPGSRQQFIKALAQHATPPHFVAVEWEQSLFQRLTAWRPSVAEGLHSCWGFLTRDDCHELACALAWEGDAYAECVPATDVLWLERGFQEADLQRRYGVGAETFPEDYARGLLERLCHPWTVSEQLGHTSPVPAPGTKQALLDGVWRLAWSQSLSVEEHGSFERDARWAAAIAARSVGLHAGWIAVVVGWAHADPAGGPRRLRGRLRSQGYWVNPVCLAPSASHGRA